MQENERIVLERRLRELPLSQIEDELAAGRYGEAKRPIVQRYVDKERRRLSATAEGRAETLHMRSTAATESQAVSARRATIIASVALAVTIIHALVDLAL